MILSVAAALVTLGFLGWILGTIFGYHGIAVIGATIVVGAGAMAMSDGLAYKNGEVETTVNNSTVETTNQYEQLDTPTHLPLASLITLLGGVMLLRSLDSFGDP